jgi:bile acid:Na+ symporter, BASS family
MTALSKGNTALSITLTAFSTLSATIMTPLNFSFWGHQYLNFYNKANASGLLQPIEIEFSQMLQTVFILLGIPLILGILFSHYLPKATSKIIKPLKIASVLIFIGFVVIAFAKNIDHFLTHIHYIFIIVLIHNALALFTGFSLSTLMGLTRPVRRSITIETGIQNSGLALALIFNPKIFPPELQLGGMAIVAAWWGIWHIISGLSMAYFWTRRDVKDEPARWSAKPQTTSIENG